jgi:hypothetical protein
MKRFLIILSIICLFSAIGRAQPVITWEKTKHNFGSFKEEAGQQTVKFTFTNTGNQPLILSNVKTNCNCLATTYSTEMIQPGAKGYVNATYDPRNRPNEFTKIITVTSNTEKPTSILTVEGKVIPREKTIPDLYPREFGDLRLKTNYLSFSKVLNTQKVIDTIEVINQGQNAIELTFENVPKEMSIQAIPTKLDGTNMTKQDYGQKGIIVISFDATQRNDWGSITDRISVIINGEKNNNYRISVSAIITEDFSHLTEHELSKAPIIEFSEVDYDFGTINQGDRAVHNFEFTNKGKSDLVIRKIGTTCGCTATNPEKMVIKSGESSHITVTFNSAGKKGDQHKTITIFTNDPKHSEFLLNIHGKVEAQ